MRNRIIYIMPSEKPDDEDKGETPEPLGALDPATLAAETGGTVYPSSVEASSYPAGGLASALWVMKSLPEDKSSDKK